MALGVGMQLVPGGSRGTGPVFRGTEAGEGHLFLYQGQLWRLISQFAVTEPYLAWKNCIKACGIKAKIASAQSVSLARYAAGFVWYVFLCYFGSPACSWCVPCTSVPSVRRALSVSRSCRPCQISGIYESWQWKTDHQASRCRTSIPAQALKQSLWRALLIPAPPPPPQLTLHKPNFFDRSPSALPQTPWVRVGGNHGPRRWPLRLARTCELVLFDSRVFPSCRFEWHSPLRSSLFLPCAVCHLTLVSPAVLFAYLRAPLCVWPYPEGELGEK